MSGRGTRLRDQISRIGWAIGSVAIAAAGAWWLHTIADGPARLLNAGQIRPILLLGSLQWILGLIMGALAFRRSMPLVRVISAAGLLANLGGLAATAMTYAKWWEA